nr:hypothetical protein HAGR004_23520 [Bdellovibrio sp. HAGR004]
MAEKHPMLNKSNEVEEPGALSLKTKFRSARKNGGSNQKSKKNKKREPVKGSLRARMCPKVLRLKAPGSSTGRCT